MIKILSSKQIKELDAFTIVNEPVSSIDLMERACKAFVDWVILNINESKTIGIVCGTGNNGGDGLGIARLLDDRGYHVSVWVVKGSVSESNDFKTNFGRLEGKLDVTEITEVDKELFNDVDVLVDGVFGSGLSRPPEGIYAKAIQCMNQSKAIRIAIDIPSGLMVDSKSTGEIVSADYTISFQVPKLAFFLPQCFQYTGEWTLVDIGLKKEFIQKFDSDFYLVTQKDVCKLLKPRSKFDHKGKFGHALLIAGSFGKIGAAVLASRAALRAGCGLLTVHVPRCGYLIIQSSVPEAMAITDIEESFFSNVDDIDRFTTLGIGPGLGKHQKTAAALKKLMEKFKKPMVIDADALNLISEDPELLNIIPEGSILTPHPKEFERLTSTWKDDFEKLENLRSLAQRTKCTIVLKGAFSAIATPLGKVHFNPTGNPAMATGGTGDVLTGILTGLLAQSYSGTEAAILGVYLHGLAGDFVVRERGERGLIASDLVDFIPQAYHKLIKR
jgi:ADP-dependent NAD(P)H-hydrate dehydratase / NAD(P)H-hydrate epimerase